MNYLIQKKIKIREIVECGGENFNKKFPHSHTTRR